MKKILQAVLKAMQVSRYELSKKSGISTTVLWQWLHKDSQTVALRHLSALRKASGFSWSEFGKMIDSEVKDND